MFVCFLFCVFLFGDCFVVYCSSKSKLLCYDEENQYNRQTKVSRLYTSYENKRVIIRPGKKWVSLTLTVILIAPKKLFFIYANFGNSA